LSASCEFQCDQKAEKLADNPVTFLFELADKFVGLLTAFFDERIGLLPWRKAISFPAGSKIRLKNTNKQKLFVLNEIITSII
jgi:hypothetical protein